MITHQTERLMTLGDLSEMVPLLPANTDADPPRPIRRTPTSYETAAAPTPPAQPLTTKGNDHDK
jgi:hypothetical protein